MKKWFTSWKLRRQLARCAAELECIALEQNILVAQQQDLEAKSQQLRRQLAELDWKPSVICAHH